MDLKEINVFLNSLIEVFDIKVFYIGYIIVFSILDKFWLYKRIVVLNLNLVLWVYGIDV